MKKILLFAFVVCAYSVAGAQWGSALSFSGTYNENIHLGGSLSTVDNFTFEAWVKCSSTGHYQIIFYNGKSSDDGFGLVLDGSNTLNILFGGQAWISTGVVLNSNFNHVALVNNGGVWSVYMNGVSVLSGDSTVPITPTTDFYIGGDPHNGGFIGTIDEARFSTTVRYTSNFTPPTAPFSIDASTLALYHFDEGSGTTAYDSSGNNLNLGLEGSPLPVWVITSLPSIPTAELKLWLRSDNGVTASGGSVSAWADISGNNNNAVQSTSSARPVVGLDSINGKPAITFNDQFLYLPTSAQLGIQSHSYEFYIVARPTSSGVQFLMSGSYEQYEYHLTSYGARFIPTTGVYLDESTSYTVSDGNAHVFAARASFTGGAVRIDGIDGAASTENITSSDAGSLYLGMRQGGTLPFFGDIAEVLIYDTVLTSTQRDSVERYLADRYADTSGALKATSVQSQDKSAVPHVFALNQNYPNPFNPTTTISYQLAMNSEISLKIYDMLGREVAKLVSGMQSSGDHAVEWNAAKFASGVYFYKLQAGNYTSVKKLLLLK
jgi:hypothetical protein